jgi:hypothetical protein
MLCFSGWPSYALEAKEICRSAGVHRTDRVPSRALGTRHYAAPIIRDALGNDLCHTDVSNVNSGKS